MGLSSAAAQKALTSIQHRKLIKKKERRYLYPLNRELYQRKVFRKVGIVPGFLVLTSIVRSQDPWRLSIALLRNERPNWLRTFHRRSILESLPHNSPPNPSQSISLVLARWFSFLLASSSDGTTFRGPRVEFVMNCLFN